MLGLVVVTPLSASTIATIVLVPLLAWRIYVRFRRASGRQRLNRYRGPITLTLYTLDTATSRSLGEFARSPLTLGAFGLMAGYYAWYMLGLVRWRRRVLRAKRERETQQGDA